jgi:hypothetical protein
MIIKDFSINDIDTYRLYYVLDKITDTAVTFYRRTPAGDDPFEDADILVMPDGHLVVAFTHPFKYAANTCLFAKHGDIEEIVNLNCWERVVDLYDTDIYESDKGGFFFCSSIPIFNPNQEWRCDNTMYGPEPFGGQKGGMLTGLNVIIAYEPILSFHGVGYLVYIHLKDDAVIRETHENNSEIPSASYTLSEVFKLLYEWSEMTNEPFNNTEQIAVKAKQFLDYFGFTPDLVDNQVDMQVANYIKGSQNARMRPTGIVPNKPELVNFVKKRMASSSLAELCVQYPDMWDTQEILTAEKQALDAGILRFMDYYQIPSDWEVSQTERIIEHCTLYMNPTIGPYVHNQLRLFANKKQILNAL